jgi:hypothetical protein
MVYRRRRGCSRKRQNVVSADWGILMYASGRRRWLRRRCRRYGTFFKAHQTDQAVQIVWAKLLHADDYTIDARATLWFHRLDRAGLVRASYRDRGANPLRGVRRIGQHLFGRLRSNARASTDNSLGNPRRAPARFSTERIEHKSAADRRI